MKTSQKMLLGLGVVILTVAIVIGVSIGKRRGDSLEMDARFKLTTASELLENWRKLHGSYPKDLATAATLLPSELPSAARERATQDPWHRQLTYRFPLTDPGCRFRLYSNGANGTDELGEGDDIRVNAAGQTPGCS